jgi:hypothetical protein
MNPIAPIDNAFLDLVKHRELVTLSQGAHEKILDIREFILHGRHLVEVGRK